MRKNSQFKVKYEKKVKESTLSSYGGATVFIELLKTNWILSNRCEPVSKDRQSRVSSSS